MVRITVACCLLLLFQRAVAQPEKDKDAYAIGVAGIQLIDEGDYAEGIKLLKQARNLEPHDYDFAFEIGKAYLKSGDPKKAEKYLFDLQYNKNAQADLYITLADCYRELDDAKKNPDPERKKELNALRYGVQKLPNAGVLYLELGKRKLAMERSIDALVAFETGIQKAPNFAENYFWAAKLMKASGNHLWAWFYAEICFNMTEDLDVFRSSAVLLSNSSKLVFGPTWKGEPEKLDQSLKFVLSQNCTSSKEDGALPTKQLNCLLTNWNYTDHSIAPLFGRLKELEKRGYLETYLATVLQENDKEQFLQWLANNGNAFEEYTTWRYWNPMQVEKPVYRLTDN